MTVGCHGCVETQRRPFLVSFFFVFVSTTVPPSLLQPSHLCTFHAAPFKHTARPPFSLPSFPSLPHRRLHLAAMSKANGRSGRPRQKGNRPSVQRRAAASGEAVLLYHIHLLIDVLLCCAVLPLVNARWILAHVE